MKHIYALFALLITSFVSWGQTTEILNNNLRTQDNIDLWNPISVDLESGGGGYARFTDLNSSLTTPEFNASAYNSIEVQMSVAKYGSGDNGPITVLYSLDGGVSWNVGGDSSTPSNSTYIGNTLAIDETSSTMVIRFTRTNSPSEKRFRDVIISGIGTGISCQDSNLVFPTATETADLVDGTFTQTATSLNATTAITYTSSDEDVATVNPTTGEVTLVSVGTTTITATQAAGEHNGESYCAATATYELEVITTEPVLTVSTNSLSFTGYEGGEATTQNLTITGLNLSGDISLALTGDANFAINPTTLAATGGDVTITYTPSATPATHSATLTVANGELSEVITLSGVTTEVPDIYDGVGVFEKINSLSDITEGYYILVEAHTDANAMTNNHNGTFLARESVTPIDNSIVDPNAGIVWYISPNESGYTIYNETIEKYVSYTGSSNNIQIVDAVSSNNQRWTFSYEQDQFHISNLEVTNRKLQYNSNNGQERFATYTGSQKNIFLYKLATPTPTASFEIEDLHIEHNINATTPTVAEAIVNIANLTEEFNLSVVSTTEDFVVNTTGALVNGENTIQIQLADGLAAGEYTGSIIVSLGEETLATLPLTGEVVDIPLSTPENAIEGLRIYPNPATDVVFVTSNSGAMKNVQLFDLSGKKVLDVDTTSSFQVNALANGIYVMKVTEEGKTSTSKLIVK